MGSIIEVGTACGDFRLLIECDGSLFPLDDIRSTAVSIDKVFDERVV